MRLYVYVMINQASLSSLLLLLDLDQAQSLTKPGQGRPTVKQEILEADQGLKILWLGEELVR